MSLTMIVYQRRNFWVYETHQEADEWLIADPARYAVWEPLTDGEKTRNLIAATVRLDDLPWSGSKVTPDQPRQWPRSGLVDRDGVALPTDRIPAQLERATALLAGDLALDPYSLSHDEVDQPVQMERIGPRSVTYFRQRTTLRQRQLGNSLVLELIALWLIPASDARPIATGTDDRSHFENFEEYDLTEGL